MKEDRILTLTDEIEKIAREHPTDYHRREDFQKLVDERSELVTKRGNT